MFFSILLLILFSIVKKGQITALLFTAKFVRRPFVEG